MKRQLLFLISTFCLILYSCDDSENDSLKVSQSSFNNISCDGTTLEVDVISSSDWTVSKTAKWCNVTPAKGSGNQKRKHSVKSIFYAIYQILTFAHVNLYLKLNEQLIIVT